jgi:hypothetical protein
MISLSAKTDSSAAVQQELTDLRREVRFNLILRGLRDFSFWGMRFDDKLANILSLRVTDQDILLSFRGERGKERSWMTLSPEDAGILSRVVDRHLRELESGYPSGYYPYPGEDGEVDETERAAVRSWNEDSFRADNPFVCQIEEPLF